MKQETEKGLVGRFFHSFKDGLVEWQGFVVDRVGGDSHIVQLFDWIMGDPSCQKIVKTEIMAGWDFYDTVDQMNDTYRKRWAELAKRAAEKAVLKP